MEIIEETEIPTVLAISALPELTQTSTEEIVVKKKKVGRPKKIIKIYLKLDKDPETLRELIVNLFKYDIFGTLKTVKTYYNKECTNQQCKEGVYRSFDDMLLIAKTYFPKVTPKDLIHELIIYKPKSKNVGYLEPWFISCSDIGKITFCYYRLFQIDPFKLEKKNSEFSWKQLLNMLDIKNIIELKIYIEKHNTVIQEENKTQTV